MGRGPAIITFLRKEVGREKKNNHLKSHQYSLNKNSSLLFITLVLRLIKSKKMNNYLELAQLSDGTIVLRRSDDKENPLVKIKFSGESKQLLQGQELHIAKEMIRAGIESISGNVSDFDEFFESQLDNIKKKEVTLH
jgi:hypothetical protein